MSEKTKDTYRTIKRAQIAAYDATARVTNDHAIISFALMELAVIIAISIRAKTLTKLEHRDRIIDAVSAVHDQMWEATGGLFENIQKEIRR